MVNKKNVKNFYLRGTELCETTEVYTKREIAVLWMLIQGLDNKAIAQKLAIAPCTVKFHLAVLYKKTGTRNRTELTNKIFLKLMNYKLDFETFSKILMSENPNKNL